MSLNFWTIISLSIYFLVLIAIGLLSYRTASQSSGDYLLGGRKLGPAVTAMSVGASDMSGWILMGLPGAVYVSGLGNVWIALGLLVGAYANYRLVAPKLRVLSEKLDDAITLPDYFAKRFPGRANSLKILSAIVILVFFTVYTASGVVAGGKLAETAFGMSYNSGIIITVGVVLFYTLLGGFLAVSLTDFVQGCIMLATFIILPIAVISSAGGSAEVIDYLQQQTQHLQLGDNWMSLALISSLAWGLGYFGQPHILVRFMAISSVHKLATARKIGISWMFISLTGTLLIGLAGVVAVLKLNLTLNDPETIVIVLSQALLSPAVAGVCLAAILAAIMSTISSQLLVTASALSEDLVISLKLDNNAWLNQHKVLISRIGVIVVAVIATLIAIDKTSGVLSLVANAWAGFGAAFGPLVLLSLYYQNMTANAAVTGLLMGAVTVIIWEYAGLSWQGQPLNQWVYSMVPGFLLSFSSIIIVSQYSANLTIQPQKGD